MAKDSSSMSHHDHMQAEPASPAQPSTVDSNGSREWIMVEVRVEPNPPKAGINRLTFEIKNEKTGKPPTQLKIETEVAMTSMDMGTERPKAREIKPGSYEVKVPFSMKGPWQVRIKASSAEGKVALEKAFNFDVGTNETWAPK